METRPIVWMIMLIYTCLKTGSGFHNIIIVFTFLVKKKTGFRYLIGELNKIFLKLKKFDFNPFHNAPLFLNYKITITHKLYIIFDKNYILFNCEIKDSQYFDIYVPEIAKRYLSLMALWVCSLVMALLVLSLFMALWVLSSVRMSLCMLDLFLLDLVAVYTILRLPIFPWTYFQTSGPYCFL